MAARTKKDFCLARILNTRLRFSFLPGCSPSPSGLFEQNTYAEVLHYYTRIILFAGTYIASKVLRGKLLDGSGVSFFDILGESLDPVIVASAVAALELGLMVGNLM